MANIKELADQIKEMHEKNEEREQTKKADICFDLMTLYCRINKKFITQNDTKQCCYAVVVLSSTIGKSIAERAVAFLGKYEKTLPLQASTTLRASLMRMRGF